MDMAMVVLVGVIGLGIIAEFTLAIVVWQEDKHKRGCTVRVHGTYLGDEPCCMGKRAYNLPVVRYVVGGTTYEESALYCEHLGNELRRPEPGTGVTVFYDPDNPRHFYPVGRGMEGRPTITRKLQVAIAIAVVVAFVALIVYYKIAIQGVFHGRFR